MIVGIREDVSMAMKKRNSERRADMPKAGPTRANTEKNRGLDIAD
jgi:hypothetical protein